MCCSTGITVIIVSYTKNDESQGGNKIPRNLTCLTDLHSSESLDAYNVISYEAIIGASEPGWIGFPPPIEAKLSWDICQTSLQFKTADPSQQPTVQPTVQPTIEPTLQPTTHPSVHPTAIPTGYPSDSPTTLAPSKTPTTAPSSSPTACIDFSPNINSTDGQDLIADVYFFVNNNTISDTNGTIHYYENIPFRQNVYCSNNYDNCLIDCINEFSCLLGAIFANNVGVDSLTVNCIAAESSCYSLTVQVIESSIDYITIICQDEYSCLKLKINIEHSNVRQILFSCQEQSSCEDIKYSVSRSSIINTTFLCSESYSCNSTEIHINSSASGYLHVHCIESRSCRGIDANLNIVTNKNQMIEYSAMFRCYHDNSCQNLLINANKYVYVEMMIYKWSENVFIKHNNFKKVDIKCGNNQDKRFIRYDVFDIKTDEELLDLARNEYKFSNRLPCEDIVIQCSSEKYFTKVCKWKYDVQLLNISKIIRIADDDKSDTTCVWLDVFDVFSPRCFGECDSNITLYQYNQTFQFDISLNQTNQSNLELDTKCDEFFSTINLTLDTLSDIDGIFENILKMVYNPFEIYQLIDGPRSILRHERLLYDCGIATNFGRIQLDTAINAQSGIDNKEDFDLLFVENDFIEKSQELLSLLFGTPVVLTNKYFKKVINKVDISKGFESWQVILLVSGVLLVITLIFIYVYKYCHYKKRLQLSNPMVIIYGIGAYENNPTNPEFDGIVSDLDAVEWDIRNTAALFGEYFNYTVFPHYDLSQGVKQLWKKQEILIELQKKSTELAENIKTGKRYDSLVVVFSGHGINNCVLTSDYGMITKDQIHRIFSRYELISITIRWSVSLKNIC